MTRPDFERLRREAQQIYIGAGEAAMVLRWTGSVTGNPRFGVQNQDGYLSLPITALFKSMQPMIQNMQGGWTQTNQLFVTLPFELSPRDQIIYAGSAYRVDGNPDREIFGAGRVLFHHPLKLASITG